MDNQKFFNQIVIKNYQYVYQYVFTKIASECLGRDYDCVKDFGRVVYNYTNKTINFDGVEIGSIEESFEGEKVTLTFIYKKLENMSRGGSRPGSGRKPKENYLKTYWTDSKTHATIRQIVESNKINQVQSANLSKCEGEALKNKK